MSNLTMSIIYLLILFFGPMLICVCLGIKEKPHKRNYNGPGYQKKESIHYYSQGNSYSDFNKRKPASYTGNRSGKFTGKYYG